MASISVSLSICTYKAIPCKRKLTESIDFRANSEHFFHSEIAIKSVSGPKVYIVIQMNPFYFAFLTVGNLHPREIQFQRKERERERV